MLRRVSRLALSLSCPMLGTAMLFGLEAKWTIPFVVLCAVNAVIVIAEDRIRRAADDTVGLNLHG